MPTHFIPTEVIIVSRPESSITQAHTGRAVKVRPAFAVPSTSAKMLLTARRWAASRVPTGMVIDEVTRDNTPMRNLQVIGVENRAEGGMAFKVLTDQGHYVDLREDEFMEALFKGRIGKDGFIQGEYVWSVGGNQMRIVRVGSAIYNERLKAGATAVVNGRNRVKNLRAAELVVGNEYDTALNGKVVYGGRVRRLSDRKLLFAWFLHIPSQNTFGRSTGTKTMIVSSASFALKNLGPSRTFFSHIPLTFIKDGFGQKISRDNLVWPDGRAIR